MSPSAFPFEPFLLFLDLAVALLDQLFANLIVQYEVVIVVGVVELLVLQVVLIVLDLAAELRLCPRQIEAWHRSHDQDCAQDHDRGCQRDLLFGLLAVSASAEAEPTVRVPSVEAKAGDTVTLDVAVENNPGIYALTFSFDYDTTRLELKSVTPNKAAFPGNWQTSKKGATWMSNDGDIGEDTTILTMTFVVLANAEAGDATKGELPHRVPSTPRTKSFFTPTAVSFSRQNACKVLP